MPPEYEDALGQVGVATLNALGAMEQAWRRLHPPELPVLREELAPFEAELATAVPAFKAAKAPEGLEGFHERFVEGASLVHRAVSMFCETPPAHEAIVRVLASRNTLCQALEKLYRLHRLPPLSRYFVEPQFYDQIGELDPEPPEGISVGLHRTNPTPRPQKDDTDGRGGFCLYVPERYDGSAEWPLVVALHGASGSGEDFLWTWLREARGRRFLLLAPTAVGSTWSMMGPDIDAPALRSMVEYVSERWRVKKSSVLLTGLSDGGTYALLCGLKADSPFTALAPLSGTLHPAVLGPDRQPNIQGRRIYMVHGARDWLFPISMARAAAGVLGEAGADLVFREIEDLSHTYPRDENDRILSWFDPLLALP